MVSLPPLPPKSTNWETWGAAVHSGIQELDARTTPTTGGVPLESFAGTTDDAKLGAALSYVSSQTYKPPILFLQNRVYGPFTTPRTIFSGMKFLGGPGFGNQYRSALSVAQRLDVNIAGGGAWLRMPASGNIFDMELSRLTFYSTSSTTDLIGASPAVLWTSVLRDIGATNFRYVLGSPTTPLLLTACLFDGWWNINNSRNTAMTLGGSDNVLWVGSNCLLDSPPTNVSTKAHLIMSYMSKTIVGNMFVTAEGMPAAVVVDGNESSAGLIFQGTRLEGRNETEASYGSVVRINGGQVTFRDVWFAFGMKDQAQSNTLSGRSGEAGIVSVFGGSALFDGSIYSRAQAAGVAESMPFIYASGANARVRIRDTRTSKSNTGTVWTGKPIARVINGATQVSDDTMTVVTT